ncbi:ABC transporter substrate-binding protein [Blastomonas sp. AAP53]|uniref:ABC transporter substrate-binding protein n=1 Tax=Blastomonas sp. AAP53 TaxID=1248760 RepID=UPI0002EF6DFC|nr:ABC transporter substrate-binding protein [Blastomonas sp. AAP53]
MAAALSALLTACSLGNAATPQPVEPPVRAMRIVSLDYCADQYVLKLVGRDRILAVSPDATRDFSYMRAAAKGMPKVAPRAEDILVLKPDLVVRSYGGGADAGGFFARAGVPVLQLGFAEDLAGVRRVLLEAAAGLGETERGEAVARELDARVAALREAHTSPFVPSEIERRDLKGLRAGPSTSLGNTGVGRENQSQPSLLYATPGGVTSGPGSLIHELIELAGYRNFQQQPGWQPLPLERLAYERPDRVAMAWFGRRDYNPDLWSAARHPLMDRASDQPPIGLEGAWTSCGGWFVLDAAEALARARGASLR